MVIKKVTYIENNYFSVKYNLNTVIQDITAIKMTAPTDPAIKVILLFLRALKLEKIQDQEIDELKYRDHVVYDNSAIDKAKMHDLMSKGLV